MRLSATAQHRGVVWLAGLGWAGGSISSTQPNGRPQQTGARQGFWCSQCHGQFALFSFPPLQPTPSLIRNGATVGQNRRRRPHSAANGFEWYVGRKPISRHLSWYTVYTASQGPLLQLSGDWPAPPSYRLGRLQPLATRAWKLHGGNGQECGRKTQRARPGVARASEAASL
jgi:hypothetical protein